MITKTTRLLALSAALLWSGVAMAQSGAPTGAPTGASPGSSSGSSPSSSSGGSGSSGAASGAAAGGAAAAPAAEAVLPADGTGIQAEESTTVSRTTTTTTDTLPRTGGAPLLMALTGALMAGSALFGLKKVR